MKHLLILLTCMIALTFNLQAQEPEEPVETEVTDTTVSEIDAGLAMANQAFQTMRAGQFYQAKQLYEQAVSSDSKYSRMVEFCDNLIQREQQLQEDRWNSLSEELQDFMRVGGFTGSSFGADSFGGGGFGGGGGYGGGMGMGMGMGMGGGGGFGGYGGGGGFGGAVAEGGQQEQMTEYDLTKDQFEQLLDMQIQSALDGPNPLARERVADLGLTLGDSAEDLTVGEYLGWARPKSANARIYDHMRRRNILRQRTRALIEWKEQKRQEQLRKKEELRSRVFDTQGGNFGGGGGFGGGGFGG